jgi:hypothetical protein
MRETCTRFTCDECGKEASYLGSGRASEEAFSKGWLIRYFNKKVHHFCSEECVAKFREENKT